MFAESIDLQFEIVEVAADSAVVAFAYAHQVLGLLGFLILNCSDWIH